MITLDQREKVIEQRGIGLSYDQISKNVGISKPTVMKICRDAVTRITEKSKEATAELDRRFSSALEYRSKSYINLVQNIVDEIEGRDLSSVSLSQLFGMLEKVERMASTIDTPELSNRPIPILDKIQVMDVKK